MQDFEEEDLPYYPPVGRGEKGVFIIEQENVGGCGILTVYVKADDVGETDAAALTKRLIEEEILKQHDSELPKAELSSFFDDGKEYYALDVVLSDEDFVYAECIVPLNYDEEE